MYLPFFQKIGKYTKICAVLRVKLWTGALWHFESGLSKYFIAVKGRPIREQVKSYHIYGETRKMAGLLCPAVITTVPVAMVPGLNSLLKHFTRHQFGMRNTFFRASEPSEKSWGHLVYLPFFRKIGKYTKICAVIRVKLWTGALCHFESGLNKYFIAVKGRPIREQVKSYHIYGETRKMAGLSCPAVYPLFRSQWSRG